MAIRKPLVLINGEVYEMPVGDAVTNADTLGGLDSTRFLNKGSSGSEYIAGNSTISFAETNNISSAGSVTIDWRTSNKQKITLTENTTFTFTNPSGPCNLVLRIIQDTTGGHTVTMPTLLTPGGSGVSFSTSANTVDLLMLGVILFPVSI